MKEKSRIVLDIDPELKEIFLQRLQALKKGAKLTGVLKLAIYRLLLLDNQQLEQFLAAGVVDGATFESYLRAVVKLRQEKLWPSGLNVGNSQMSWIRTRFAGYEKKELSRAQFRRELEQAKERNDSYNQQPWESLAKYVDEYSNRNRD
jgi:hypothetical protein